MQAYALFDANGGPSGFYFESVHGPREIDGELNPDSKIPPGAIVISDEDYLAFIEEQGQWRRDPATGLRVAAPPPPPPTTEEIIGTLVAALETYYDTTAQTRRYDNRLTCALRAGYAGPFQAEGLAFALWMDGCNAYGYQVLAECLAGTRAIPTPAELIAELPVIVWP